MHDDSKFCVYGTFGYVCDGFTIDKNDVWGVFDSYADARDYVEPELHQGRGRTQAPKARAGRVPHHAIVLCRHFCARCRAVVQPTPLVSHPIRSPSGF